ncbi:MAG: hypothetical protein K1X28_06345 [Parachlamydiales bacterium]|nr:hypothetical protein [Parachlamydiales bacterium]
MHKKERAIAPAFEKFLGCKVVPVDINTDLFGTFAGEIERTLSPYACAKEKCIRGLNLGNGVLGIANEGSFGPDPSFPFVPADFEILYFIDRDLEFDLMLSKSFPQTNFSGKSIPTLEELAVFADQVLFPSHALVLRPHRLQDSRFIFKGIRDAGELRSVFQKCLELSSDGLVWVETDMRAHMNPTRMKNIEALSNEMAVRLAAPCPSCKTPGWGVVKKMPGLLCKMCEAPTELIKSEIYGCCKCKHQEELENYEQKAEPDFCPFCNP